MIAIRTEREIALLREANRIVAETLCALADRVEPGITTAELDAVAEKLIRAAGGERRSEAVVRRQAIGASASSRREPTGGVLRSICYAG